MGTDPDGALWDMVNYLKQQVQRTARAGPFSPKPLSPSELTIDRYLTCPQLAPSFCGHTPQVSG
jgi:hypothetical protein